MKKQSLIFSSLLALAVTMLVSVSASAQGLAHNPLQITAEVTNFKPANCGEPGSIIIGDITIPIAAGTQVTFLEQAQVTLANGGLGLALVPSEVWQVMGNAVTGQPPTVRNLNVYLNQLGQIRLQLFSTAGLSGGQATFSLLPAAARPREVNITGLVTAISPDSLTINGLTFKLGEPLSPEIVVDPLNKVRITGTLDSSNRLIGARVIPAYTTATFPRLVPTSLISVGLGLTPNANPFNAAGPIAGSVFIYNPLGTSASQFLCDLSVERLVLGGQPPLFFAPNFSLFGQIPLFVPAEFTFQRDQFGLIAAGSRK